MKKSVSVLILLALLFSLSAPAQAEFYLLQQDYFQPGVWESCFWIGGINEGLYHVRLTISEEYQFLLKLTCGEKEVLLDMQPSEDDFEEFRVFLTYEQDTDFPFLNFVSDIIMTPFQFGGSEDFLRMKIKAVYKDGINFLCVPEGFFDRPMVPANEGFTDDFSNTAGKEEIDHLTPVFCTEDKAFIREEWASYRVTSSVKPFLIRFHFNNEEHHPFDVDDYAETMYLLLDDGSITSYSDIIFPLTEEGTLERSKNFDLVFWLNDSQHAKALLAAGKSFDLGVLPDTGEKLMNQMTPEQFMDRLYNLSDRGASSTIHETEWLSGNPYIQGKMLIGVYQTETKKTFSMDALTHGRYFYGMEKHRERLAANMEEAGTIVLITMSGERVGTYSNGGVASRIFTNMYIYNKERDGAWSRIFVASDDPPETGEVPMGSAQGLGGDFKPEEAVKMLLEMEYRP